MRASVNINFTTSKSDCKLCAGSRYIGKCYREIYIEEERWNLSRPTTWFGSHVKLQIPSVSHHHHIILSQRANWKYCPLGPVCRHVHSYFGSKPGSERLGLSEVVHGCISRKNNRMDSKVENFAWKL